jgi:hypothetical protein
MKSILLLLSVCFVGKAFCQNFDIYKRKTWENKKFQNLWEKILPREKLQENKSIKSDTPYNTMPVIKQKLSPKYSGNNGKGADVYAMMPYNMPCLVPDSTFRSSMPVKLKKEN